MSLSKRVRDPAVREAMEPLLPETVGSLDLPLLVDHAHDRYPLVGTAVDYALRFEVRRRAEDVEAGSWVAESTASMLSPRTQVGLPPHHAEEIGKLAGEAIAIVQDARDFVDNDFVPSKEVDRKDRESLARHAIRLAGLDTVYRGRESGIDLSAIDPYDVHEDDVGEVADLVEATPFPELLSPAGGTAWLNPTFGEYSRRAGGADADLVLGDRLLEIKTTINPSVGSKQLRQLLAYKVLWDEHARDDGGRPAVSEIGIYFPRQAHLWTTEVDLDRSSDAYQLLLDELLDPLG